MNSVRNFVHCTLLLLSISLAYSQEEQRKNPSSKFAMSLQMRNFDLEEGVIQGLYWPSDGITLRFGLQLVYDVEERTPFGANPLTVERSIAFSLAPRLAILKRFLARENVSPYIGGQIQTQWFLKNHSSPRYTIVRPALVFGVEAWVTDDISVAGEQVLEAWLYVNRDSAFNKYNIGQGSLIFSFYF